MTTNVVPLPVSYPKKRISIVMVSYYTGPSLMESVPAVLADPDILELIIVDNGNTVSARQRLWALAKDERRIRLVQGHGNIGFGRACNYGAKLAKGDYILFLNPDAVIEKGTAMTLAECGDSLTRPWIAGGNLQTVNGVEQRGSRRSALTPMAAVVSFTPLHKLPGFKSIHLEHLPLPDAPVEMPIVSGACLMVDQESFDMLGGFDERYFLHVEDIDICRRAKLSGGDVFFVPDAKVMHYGSTSRARIVRVESNKFRGFVRYFWDYTSHWWSKTLLVLSLPFMYFAIMGRAWWLSVRNPWLE
ncbi:MAG: glycosyltransferase family 2 protein [Robiginitomaculum sp.]|nr:glycosyltransferase family 2 protein [Robiginitomaculum sp.]